MRFHTSGGAESLFARPATPLLNPPVRGTQGVWKAHCVTECLKPAKTNETVSFNCAESVGGVKKLPSNPTVTFSGSSKYVWVQAKAGGEIKAYSRRGLFEFEQKGKVMQ